MQFAAASHHNLTLFEQRINRTKIWVYSSYLSKSLLGKKCTRMIVFRSANFSPDSKSSKVIIMINAALRVTEF